MQVGIGECYGTFGELIQGIIHNKPFLIPLPIQLKSRAIFQPNQKLSTDEIMGDHTKLKAITACKHFLRQFHVPYGGYIRIDSNIPVGKGMASSTADIVAVIRAAASSFQNMITPELISRISASIEPTDGLMYEETVAFDYIHGKKIERFERLPAMVIVGIDTGGVVSTVQFNQKHKSFSIKEKILFEEAYHFVKTGIYKQNIDSIYEATKISAEINQRFLPKPFFRDFKQLAEQYQCGLVVAHSGTMIGLLFSLSHFLQVKKNKMKQEIQSLTNKSVKVYHTVHNNTKQDNINISESIL